MPLVECRSLIQGLAKARVHVGGSRGCIAPVRLMMEASPAPITILQASSVQKLLARPHPTDDTMKMPIPQPATISKLITCCLSSCIRMQLGKLSC